MKDAKQVLKEYFGYDSFRPMQEEIIQHTINGGDSLVLMPTGGGKSLCFQMAALMMDGIVVVVSPLISLMKDQVGSLRANGISAEALNSSNDEGLNNNILERCIAGQVKLLYISPERLVGGTMHLLQGANVSLIAIDEAHCISTWGHDFRPEYTQLGQLRQLFPKAPIMALTATADKITKQDILAQLHIENGQTFIGSFDRPNLSLDVRRGYSAREKLRSIMDLIKRHAGESGIIYCLARKTTEDLAEKLKKEGVSVGVYHAGLPNSERNQVQDDFVADKIQVICATIAFGMGIDKSNIRFIAHYNLPKSIESFYQEIGRGGRDGLPCKTILYYNLGDIITLRRFVDESGQREINLEKLQRMQEYAEAQVCRRRILLNYFGEISDRSCGNCDVCHTPPQVFDGTIIAQKALSAIMRTNESIGFTVAIDILRGNMSAEVVAHNYNQLKTFAAGRDIPHRDWHDYLLQLLQMGFVEIAYNEDRHIHVTPLGKEVLKGQRAVQLAMINREDLSVKARRKRLQEEQKNARVIVGRDENKELFDKLRQVRKRIADENHWPAYVVMSDRSLHALAIERPTTLQAFGNVFGIGEHKRDTYGLEFLAVIREDVTDKEELPFPDPGNSTKEIACLMNRNTGGIRSRIKKMKLEKASETTQKTLKLLDTGLTPSQIAAKRKLTESTVYNHIEEFVGKGVLDASDFVSNTKYNRIKDAIQTVQFGKLSEIKAKCGEDISYAEIKIVLADLQRKKGSVRQPYEDVTYTKSSKKILSCNCRVVLAQLGYFLELNGEFIKLGDIAKGFSNEDGDIFIKKPKNELGYRIFHETDDDIHLIGYILEKENTIVFTSPNNDTKIINVSDK